MFTEPLPSNGSLRHIIFSSASSNQRNIEKYSIYKLWVLMQSMFRVLFQLYIVRENRWSAISAAIEDAIAIDRYKPTNFKRVPRQ
jgi:hypothetical protein